jgi:hypothetical protein
VNDSSRIATFSCVPQIGAALCPLCALQVPACVNAYMPGMCAVGMADKYMALNDENQMMAVDYMAAGTLVTCSHCTSQEEFRMLPCDQLIVHTSSHAQAYKNVSVGTEGSAPTRACGPDRLPGLQGCQPMTSVCLQSCTFVHCNFTWGQCMKCSFMVLVS